MAEIRLYEQVCGFYSCLQLFEDVYRDSFWECYLMGRGNCRRDVCLHNKIWPMIMRAQRKVKDADDKYRELRDRRLGWLK